jgi:hypothetical protein
MKWRVSSCSFHAKRSMFGLLPSECPPSAIMRNLRGRSAGLRCHYCDTSKQVQLEHNSKHTIVPRLQHCVNKIGWLMLVINTELSLELITFELSPSNSSPCVSNESWLMRCHLPTGHSHWTRHCTWSAGEEEIDNGKGNCCCNTELSLTDGRNEAVWLRKRSPIAPLGTIWLATEAWQPLEVRL